MQSSVAAGTIDFTSIFSCSACGLTDESTADQFRCGVIHASAARSQDK